MKRVRPRSARQWELWTAPPPVIALVLAVDVVALSLTVLAAVHQTVATSDLVRFAGLLVLALGYTAFSSRIERTWLLLAVSRGTTYVDFLSVWTFAAAVLLPTSLMAPLVVAIYLQAWLRASVQPAGRPRLYRHIYTLAAKLIAAYCTAQAVMNIDTSGLTRGAAGAVSALAAGVLVFFVVDTTVVALALYVSGTGSRPSEFFTSWSENGVDLATLVLGAMTALSLVYAPWAAVLVLPAVFLLQYQALLRQLVEAATTDVKTELLNATAWRQVAQREITRASQRGGSVAVVVLDMDYFKRINDAHGHLAGDAALKCVGAALADELRGHDAVGRFGGEEFVAALPDIDASDAGYAAERLRRRIESLAVPVPGRDQTLNVTASIGVALCPDHGDSLDDVLCAADDALYKAKRAGRNTVRLVPAAVPLRAAAS
jgi:diguanylate cyclase (GGDEF)-like protein